MVLTKYTGSTPMDGNEDDLFKIVGTTLKHFASYIYLKALQVGDSIRLRVYNRVDDVSRWKFDGDVTDSVGSNNGTITNISSWVSQWKFDGNVNDSIDSNNGAITYNTNLRALLKFESNTNDSSASANNFTVSGTSTYVTGKEGNAFSFNGSTNMSKVSFSNLALTTANRSVSFWIYPTTFTNNAVIFEYGAAGTRTLFSVRFNGTAGKLALYDGTNTTATTGNLNLNTWNYVSFVLSSVGTVLNIYINGVQDSQTTITALNTSTSTVFIGSDISSANELPSGTILDEVRYYDISLTQAQVSALYMNGKFAQSHTFDDGEYITAGNPSNLNFERTNSFSISVWVKYTYVGGNQFLIGKASSIGAQGYEVFLDTFGFVEIRITNTATTNEIEIINEGKTINDGNWHHVVWTYAGTSLASGIVGYIDGIAYSNTITSNNLSATILNAVNFSIGATSAGTGQFQGQLDDVRIYNTVLSASQVLGLYNYTGSNYVSPLPVGNALSLDGSSYVTVTNTTPYNFERTNPFSISGWIKTTSNTLGIIEKNNGDATQGYQINLNASGKIQIRLINTSSTNEINVVDSGSAINDGNWHNVMITYAGTSLASGISLYIDGSLRSLTTTTNNLSATIQNTNNIIIGATGNAGQKFTGLLDEVQIFPYVVSSAEINAINAGRFANAHNIGYWKFDGDLYDYSGQGSTGSPTGTMTYVTGALSGSYDIPNTHFNFDGSEYVAIGNPSNLQFEKTDSFSIALWFKGAGNVGFNTGIVTKAAGSFNNGIALNLNGTAPQLFLVNTNSTNAIIKICNTNINDNLWHFVVVTYNGTSLASGVNFYVDGSLSSATTSEDNLISSIKNSVNWTIGSYQTGDEPISAEIEDVRIYNRALSSAEVSDLYTYPDSAMKQLVYDRTYSGTVSDAKYVPFLQGTQYKVTAQQISGTNRIISWEREEVT